MAPAALEFGQRGDKEHQGADDLERHPGLRAPEPRQAPALRHPRRPDGPRSRLRLALSAARLPRRGEIPARPLEAGRGARVPARLRARQAAAQSDDRGDRLRLRRRAALAALPLALHGRARPRHRYALRVQPAARAGRRAGERVGIVVRKAAEQPIRRAALMDGWSESRCGLAPPVNRESLGLTSQALCQGSRKAMPTTS